MWHSPPYLIRLDLLGFDHFWRARPALRNWYEQLRGRDSAAAVLGWYDPENIDLLTTRGRAATEQVKAILAEGVAV